MKIPFPWFGGKSLAADLIWSRLGSDCKNYAEPFFGSGAVWLNRPNAYHGWSVVNDIDGNIANLWRAMKHNPAEVAIHACHPVNEADLHARHLWLVNNLPKLSARLMADPDYHEPRTAGWWVWGACIWIGSGWCSGNGPWHVEPDAEGVATLTKVNSGKGVNRQLPHLGRGTGVNRKLPQGDRLAWLTSWFQDLQDSLAETRIACGDWSRIMSPGTLTRNGTCAVLLDPPYSQTDAVYAHDSSTIAHAVHAWCEANADNPRLRIALCGHDGEHDTLEQQGWSVSTWTKLGGYSGKTDTRERIWFSPHCIQPALHDELF